MKLDQYGKFNSLVLLYGADKKAAPLRSEFDDHEKMIQYISDSVGTSMRRRNISKLTINVNRHSAKFIVNYISQLYMSAWEKGNYDVLVPGNLLKSIRIYLDYWLDDQYAMGRIGKTEVENVGIETDI